MANYPYKSFSLRPNA